MKQTDLRKAVNLTASVLAALLLIGTTGLLTGCPHKPKAEPDYGYKVEHWQQNAENDEYAKVDEESLKGKEGKMTSAKAKTYEGFTAQGFSQAAIRADGSTVVRINYNRNIITLKIKFAENYKTEPKLEAGADGTKLFKGRYGTRLLLKNLDNDTLVPIWPQDAPKTFPSSSEDKVYNLTWEAGYKIRVKGDRFIPAGSEVLVPGIGKTWSDVKEKVKGAIVFSSDYQGGDYEVYEWRLTDENGPKLNDDYQISGHISVYALTNYAKFNLDSTGTKIILTADGKGYTGEKPKGKIIIPEGITEIEDGREEGYNYYSAFKNCGELTGVVFPKSLTKIGDRAFVDCTGLTSIDLSSCTNLTTIGEGAFVDCTGLTSIDLSSCTNLTTIGEGAFVGCTGLTSINLPKGLTKIGMGAFGECTGLTSINLPKGLTEIGEEAFSCCTGLTSLDLSGCTSLTAIDEEAFRYCTGLTSINLPKGLTQIGAGAFAHCKSLTSINLPAGLTTIDEYAFAYCESLTSATFADPAGWAVYFSSDYSGTPTPIQENDLKDAAKAAEYLRDTYGWLYWKKN